MKRHRMIPVLLLAGATVALAACGSDSDSSANTTSTSTITTPATDAPPASEPPATPSTTDAPTTTASTPGPQAEESAEMATPESSERLLAAATVELSLASCNGLDVAPTAVCGTASVPADWATPDAGNIDVAYVVVRSVSGESSGASTGTVIPFMGGPGESITEQLGLFGPFSDQVPDSDLLVVDVRGAGRSGALTCAVLDDATELALGDAQARDTGICGEQIGQSRNNYTTVASVLDIEAIRRELDLAAPSLIGFSYGTFMAQTYTTLFPDEVRGTVLDGAFPIEQTGWGTDIPTNIKTVLELRCERTGACPNGAEAIADSIRTVAADLADTPIDLPGVNQQLTEGAFASLVQFAVQNSDMASFVTMMSAAADGDFTGLNEFAVASFANAPVGPTSYSPALYSTIACNDYVAQFDFDDDISVRRLDFEQQLDDLPDDEFGPFSKHGWIDSAWEEGDMCLDWPTPDIAPELRIPRNVERPDVPVLVVNGDIDMQTPLPGARRVAAMYPNSVLLTVPNAGHVALPASECAAQIEFAFLADPVLPQADACADEQVPE